MTFNFGNLDANAGVNPAAAQAIARARALFGQTQQQYGLKSSIGGLGNAAPPLTQGQGLGIAKNLFPTLGGIPGGSNIGNTNINLGSLNNTILNLRKRYGGKIAGEGSSDENLQALLNSGNTPLTKEEAQINSFNFYARMVEEGKERYNKPDEELARLQDEIDAIKYGGGEGSA
jgi:hypothetical protein